jgi:hypothetical protein
MLKKEFENEKKQGCNERIKLQAQVSGRVTRKAD